MSRSGPGVLAATAPPVQRAEEGSYADGYASLLDFAMDDARRCARVRRTWACGGSMARAACTAPPGSPTPGELTLIQCGPPEQGGGHVEVLGVFGDRDELDAALTGWREVCGRPGSAEWLRERATSLAVAG